MLISYSLASCRLSFFSSSSGKIYYNLMQLVLDGCNWIKWVVQEQVTSTSGRRKVGVNWLDFGLCLTPSAYNSAISLLLLSAEREGLNNVGLKLTFDIEKSHHKYFLGLNYFSAHCLLMCKVIQQCALVTGFEWLITFLFYLLFLLLNYKIYEYFSSNNSNQLKRQKS